MKYFVFYIRLILIIGFTISCLKQTESITPLSPVKTLAQIQREALMASALEASGSNSLSKDAVSTIEEIGNDPNVFYLNLKYALNDVDVYETAHIPNGFEQISNSLIKSFAKILLKISGEKSINIGLINVDLPDLKLDFNIIKSIKVKRVYLQYNKELDEETGNMADFSFLKTLTIKNMAGQKIISYTKASNICDQKCLDFHIDNGNILSLLKDAKVVTIEPTVTISSFPKIEELRIDGEVDLQIGLQLPF